jgi:hypothetical protein
MLLSLALWIQATDFFTALRGSAYMYPIVLSIHMVAIAMFGGMILMTDMRLLGWAMRRYPVADVVDQFRVLMLGCKAEEYYYNAFLRAKLVLLILVAVHALVFRASVYEKAAEFDRTSRIPMEAKVAAALSLILWIGIACMGRGIGYIEPPIGIHAQLWPL